MCPICKRKEILVEHHIEGRDIPNADHSSNLVYICDNDHRKVHEGIVILERWVMSTDGMKLLWHYEDEEGITGTDAKPYIIPKS